MLRNTIMFAGALLLAMTTACSDLGSGADGDDESAEATEQAVLTFRFTVFPNPYGDRSPNPLERIRGVANGYVGKAGSIREWTVTSMNLRGLPPNRKFGAHAHALPCENTQGGGHYQHVPGTIDPATSEIWLDFTTDESGAGEVFVLSPFAVRPGGVQSVVIHSDPTNPETGKAGAKLACANLELE